MLMRKQNLDRRSEDSSLVIVCTIAFRQRREGPLIWHFCKRCPEWPTENYRGLDDVGPRSIMGKLCTTCKTTHDACGNLASSQPK
jgi:hypothetical protein